MNFPRGSGILLHPTSLPGDFGIGDLGPDALRFVDLLASSVQTYWQILPLSPTGYGDSPYQSVSAFAGNTLLISPEKLVEYGFITVDDTTGKPDFPADKVDYGAVYEWKGKLLLRAYNAFRSGANKLLRAEFDAFCQENTFWLHDYALFQSIRAAQSHRPWYEWPADLKMRNEHALRAASEQFGVQIETEKFFQFLFFRQWAVVKTYANTKEVKIIGDIPIFVALDSADVWCNRDKFKLNADGTAKVVAGVPPDFFSATGQLWGNPIYDWDAMRADKFEWWQARIGFALRTADIVRLDHFIGFSRNWEVPAGHKTAEHGRWIDVPGREFFSVLKQNRAELPIIAEDLGAVTPEVEKLRDEFDFPGMRILQNAFGGDTKNQDLPHNHIRNCIVYTGTHDNDTICGWYRSAPKNVRSHCRKYLHSNGREIHRDMIRAARASVADTAIIPMQDILGLDSGARMNTPATNSGNWQWRFRWDNVTDEIAARLKDQTELYGR